MIDQANNVTALVYDDRGRKIQQYDPDLGVWNYSYNALGELRQQQDAKGQVTTLNYDKLGRMTVREDPSLKTEWFYGRPGGVQCSEYSTTAGTRAATSAGAASIGKLCSAKSGESYQRVFAYDAQGRVKSTQAVYLNAGSLTSSMAYDSQTGRVKSQTYPGGFLVQYGYTSLGYLKELRDGNGGLLFNVSGARTAAGQLKSYAYGNGVTTTQDYFLGTGKVNTIKAGASNSVQNLMYTYDAMGSLKVRTDSRSGGQTTIDYDYDELNRLKYEHRTGAGLASEQVMTWSYDAIGNLIERKENGMSHSYNYNTSGVGSLRPHAVGSVSGMVGEYAAPRYEYDANGNLTGGAGRSVVWNSFNKVEAIAAGNKRLSWLYGDELERAQEVYKVNDVVQRTTCHRQSNNPQMWQSNIPHPSHARSIRWNRKIDINSLKSLRRRGGNPD